MLDDHKIYHWTQCKLKCHKSPRFTMLGMEGEVLLTRTKLAGEPREGIACLRAIRYDKDYIIYWILEKLLKHFCPPNKSVFLAICEEAYDEWHKGTGTLPLFTEEAGDEK